MNNLNGMTDSSFTQTTLAMSSLPLNRSKGSYKPVWQIAAENNAKSKQLRVTKCKNPAVFTSL